MESGRRLAIVTKKIEKILKFIRNDKKLNFYKFSIAFLNKLEYLS